MSKNMHNLEHGQIMVFFAMFLVVLFGFVALAVDGGAIYAERRKVQNAADNAALAGAFALCNDQDVASTAVYSAQQNGYTDNGETITVQINTPPIEGPNAGNSDFVEVQINSKIQMTFAKVIYTGPFEISSRAVGHCQRESAPVGGGNGLIVLHPDSDGAIEGSGSAMLNVTGGIFVDSQRSKAIKLSGSATITSDSISVVGNYNVWGPEALNPTPVTGVIPIPDPLAELFPPPLPPGIPIDFKLSGGTATIDPGIYKNIVVSGGGQLTLNPGIYYIQGGEFSSSGGGSSIAGDGVLIYLDEGKVDLSGGGTFDLSAPISGQFQGLVFFLDQDNVSEIVISGGSTSSISGTIYAANSRMKLSGSSGAFTLNAQIIVSRLNLSGSSTVNVEYDPSLVFQFGANDKRVSLTE